MMNKRLDDYLQGVNTVAIGGHGKPDGDCVGSTLAVYNYIRDNYPAIQVTLYLEPIRDVFRFLQRSSEICSDCQEDKRYDLFIALDCSDALRLGKSARYFESADHTLCVDHHISNAHFADENYIDPEASSASELVFDLMDKSLITKEIAECLYTGITHDTGVFRYSCTSSKTMETAGFLMELGIDYPRIIDDTFYSTTFEQNRILGQALVNANRYFNDRVIVSVITQEEMKKWSVTPSDLGAIVSQLRITTGVVVALFLYETDDGLLKGSLRVNGDVDLARIAQTFGGGGHVKAAGFTIEGPAEAAISRVLTEIGKQL